LFMDMLGAPRTMGRVYGWLLISDPPQQSLTELAQALSVSKASVSTVARQLQEGGLIERLPSSTRQHLYRVTPGGFTSVLSAQLSRMKFGIDAADFGLSLLDKTRTEQRERLEDFRDFCEFSAQDYRDELLQRWSDYRAQRRQTSNESAAPRSRGRTSSWWRCAPRNSTSGRPISCADTRMPSCCTSAAVWTGASSSTRPTRTA
jgi:DNA-binding transcriptional regulator GbsR (MarR family)